jgi:hypothetical protein
VTSLAEMTDPVVSWTEVGIVIVCMDARSQRPPPAEMRPPRESGCVLIHPAGFARR